MGTQNYIAKFGAGGSADTDSVMYDDGTNIGIGTASPSVKLDVRGSGVIAGKIKSTDDNADFDLDAGGSTGGDMDARLSLSRSGSSKWTFRNDGSESDQLNVYNAASASIVFAVQQGGNVGVGTSDPDYSLDVEGNNAHERIKLKSTATGGTAGLYLLSNNNANGWTIRGSGDSTPDLEFFDDSSTQVVTFQDGGNVGIGDTSPDHKLDVAGNIGMDAGCYLNFGDTDGSSGYGLRDNSGTIELKDSGGSWAAVGGAASNNMWTRDSGNGEVNLSTSTDQVGIGTSDPDKKLHLALASDACTLLIDTYDTSSSYSQLHLRKSDTTTIGDCAGTEENDILGQISFYGCHNLGGSPNWSETSRILVTQESDSIVGSMYVASQMEFFTCNGSDAPESRMLIGEQGFVGIDISAPSEKLDVNGRLRLRDMGDTVPNNDGTIWYDDTNNVLKVRLNGDDYTIDTTIVP